jgi:hypothetical protein
MNLAKSIRNISKKEAIQSYEDLKQWEGNPGLGRAGLKTLDYYFFHNRLKTKTKNISFYDAMKDPSTVKHLDSLSKKYKKKSKNTQKNRYSVFQLYYGSVNQFRPVVAKWIYETLKPTSILDFSAGWGGRCLAAISLHIPYTGIDTNFHLKKGYADMIHTFQGKAHILFQPAEQVDYSKLHYDLCFTSPPYYTIEKYEHMPSYPTKQDFNNNFLIPVIQQVWKYLKINGNLALNIPEDMYAIIKPHLPVKAYKLPLPMANKNMNAYTEFIYIWKKSQ